MTRLFSFVRTPFIVLTLSLMLCVPFGEASAHPGSGIVVDKDGNIFFTDTGRGVWKIDTDGKLTYMPASQFHWMALDEAGYFSASQKSFGGWFERVTPQGEKPAIVMSSDFPFVVNQDGNIYYADTRSSSRIVRRTPDGTESVLASGTMFQGIAGMAAGGDGSLYVTDAGDADATTIRKITTDGTLSTVARYAGKDNANDNRSGTSASYCRGLVVDSLGGVYVAATGSRSVIRITGQDQVTTILQSQSPWSPTGVALFRGEVYVLEWRDPPPSREEERKAWIPRVRKVGRDGKITTLAAVSR